MKFRKYAIVMLFVLMGRSSQVAISREEPKALPDDLQIVSDELQTLLKEKSLSYADSAWPKDLNKRKVQAGQIPRKVLVEANKWLRTMIKDKYLPKDPNTWLAGIRAREADYLVMRYSVGAYKVQVQEDGTVVRVLIEVNEPNLWKEGFEDFLTGAVREFLNYPLDKLDKLKFDLKTFEYGTSKKLVAYGKLECDYDPCRKDAWKTRIWWNQTYVWTDGKRVYFSMVERDGKRIELTQAKPGIPRRFRTKN